MKCISSKEITISKWEILSLIMFTVFFSAWNIINTKTFYFETPLFFLFLSFFCWLTGKLIVEIFPHIFKNLAGFNLYFILGFYFINSLILCIQFIFPFSLKMDLIVSLFCILIAYVTISKVSKIRIINFMDSKDNLQSFLSLMLIMLATSLWTQSSINAVLNSGEITIYKPWMDSFFHARQICAFTASHGFNTIGNMLVSGKPPIFYHYASYIIPAELCSFTPTTSFQSFCSFLIPCGLFLTGLAAFILIELFWGSWAGFAACVALFLIPDPSRIILNNHWYSYQWLQQISPSGMYGIALMAIAWIFMLEGCKKGIISAVIISYLITILCINYKFHLFFANSFIIWIYPTLFFNKFSKVIKSILFIFAAALYIAIIIYSQKFTNLPYINLDGSAISNYSTFVLSMCENKWLQSFFSAKISTGIPFINTILNLCFWGMMIFINTFGIFGLLYFIILWLQRKKINLNILIFPLIIIVNYMVMSLGLAYDKHGIAMPEELIHRPFIWAYFIVCIWVGGAIYFYLQDYLVQNNKIQKSFIFIIIISFLFIPYKLGVDIQGGISWGKSYINNQIPTGLVNCCDYIRNHSSKNIVIQDSRDDRFGEVTALSERQCFVINYFTQRILLPEQITRIEAVSNLKNMKDESEIKNFFSKNKIDMYVLHSDEVVSWPKNILDKYVYQSYGYKVYSYINSFN